MKVRILVVGTTLALTGWFALASASSLKPSSVPGEAVIQNEQIAQNEERRERNDDEWYQGQRGHWHQEPNGWQWRGDRDDR